MDFKYIEQLLERFFDGTTTLEEEHLLHDFFRQDEVPEHLREYQPLFQALERLSAAHLDEHFDQQMLQLVGETHVAARRISLSQRLRPLFKAAAMVAFAIVAGMAVEQASRPAAPEPEGQVAFEGDDEFDASEVTPLDIRSASATEVADTLEHTY